MLGREELLLMRMLGNSILGAENYIECDEKSADRIYELSTLHGVNSLLVQEFATIFPQNIISDKLKKEGIRSIVYSAQYVLTQQEIVDKMNEALIDYTLLKGYGISCYYPSPRLRTSTDIDIFVQTKDLSKIEQLLVDLGYNYNKTNTEYHSSYIRNNYEIEVHNALAGLPRGRVRKKFECMRTMCERTLEVDCGSGTCRIPSQFDNVVIQLLHIIHHTLQKGMKLRILLDWLVFVKSNLNDSLWNEVEPRLKEMGLNDMAMVLTKIGNVFFGLGDKNITWYKSVSDDKCYPFVEYIFESVETESRRERTKKEYETELSDAVWNQKNSYFQIVYSNLSMVLTGKRSIRQVFRYSTDAVAKRNKLWKLQLMRYSMAKYYGY